MKKVLLSAAILGLGLGTFAQDATGNKVDNKKEKGEKKYRDLAVTLGLGTTVGFTDVKQYDRAPVLKYESELGFAAFGAVEKYFSSIFGLQGQIAIASVKGTERNIKLVSKANTMELGVNGILNVSNLGFSGKVEEKKTLVYLTAGVGLSFFRSSLAMINDVDKKVGSASKTNGQLTSSAPWSPGYKNAVTDTKGDKTKEGYIPVGIGVRYKLNQNIDLGFEVTSRNYLSDKLDAMRAGDDDDRYLLTALTGTYKLGNQEEALVWADPLTVLVNDVASNKKKVDAMTADSDKDGVADYFDKESGSEEGAIVDGAGQTLDLKDNSDEVKKLEDRVSALESAKPTAVNPVTGEAEPVAGGSGFSGYLPSVYFSSNSARVDAKGQAVIAEIAKSIGDSKAVTVVGHTDKTGTDSYNQKLGERRANAIVNVLVGTYGFDKSIFTVKSEGESEQKGSAAFANRRADVIIK